MNSQVRYNCELHMLSRNPSYITKSRHGIWYFQFWMPERVRYNGKTRRKLIRRSLRTRNRNKALRLARKWWLNMHDEDNNNELIPRDQEKWEREFEREKDLYETGAKWAQKLEIWGIDRNNYFQMESFLDSLTPDQLDAFIFYDDYNQAIKAKTKEYGTPDSGQQVDLNELARILREESISKYTDEDNPTLEQLLKNWQDSISHMRNSAAAEYVRMTNLFSQIITELNGGDSPRIASLNKTMIRRYKEIFKKIPKNAKTPNKSIAQLEALRGEPKSTTTQKITFGNICLFLTWIAKETYPIDRELIDTLKFTGRIKERDKKKRVPFDDNDLKKLFESSKYRHGKFKHACDFWAPLIALFTGARLGEIVQIYTEDVREIDGIFVFDINDNYDKQLKNEGGSPRIVPIHSLLKNLGFVEFVKHQKAQGHLKLFPEEERTARGLFGRYSKRFRTYRNSVDAGPRNEMEYRDFHSFRHLVRTRLAEACVAEIVIDEIVGHRSEGRSIGANIYTHSDRLKQKSQAMKKLQYDIDFGKIRNWKNQKFFKLDQ